MESPRGPQMAALVDAENVGPSHLEPIRRRLASLARIATLRIYGDWSLPAMGGWRDVVLKSGALPIQQFRNVAGKNAIDSALIIDAMDLLHERDYDTFAICSSDSDYTRLATRLREQGRHVIGVGFDHAPRAFRSACDRFFRIEDLVIDTLVSAPIGRSAVEAPGFAEIMMQALQQVDRVNGVVSLTDLAVVLKSIDKDFSPRVHGAKKLSDLLVRHGFELVARGTNRVAVRLDQVRFRPSPPDDGPVFEQASLFAAD